MPTRNARNGHLFTRFGDLRIRNARYKTDERAARPRPAPARPARGFSRAYLHHLDRCGEMLAPMLASVHNLHFYVNLMREVRAAIETGTFAAFAAAFAPTARAASDLTGAAAAQRRTRLTGAGVARRQRAGPIASCRGRPRLPTLAAADRREGAIGAGPAGRRP